MQLGFPARGEIAETDGEQTVFALEIEGFHTLALEFPGESLGVFHFRERADLDRVTQPGNALVRRGAAAANEHGHPEHGEECGSQGLH